MPSRLIRDDMLDSERVQTLPIEARWLYVSVLLSADDVGLFEVNPFKLGRRAGIDQQKIALLVQLMADADLVRLYESGGKRFGFIPRYRQRLQIKRTRHPVPCAALIADDEDAIKKISSLGDDPTVDNGDSRNHTVAQPSEPEPEPEEEIKDLAPTVLVDTAGAAPTAYKRPACPTESLVALFHEHLPHLPRVEILSDSRKRHASARWAAVCGDAQYDREQGLSWFAWFFAHVAKSRFLSGKVSGRSGSPFRCTFDFLMTPEKFTRVVENFYHKEVA